MFLGRINTRVYTKLLPQYQTVQKCAVPTKPIFHQLEQVRVKCFLGGRGLHKNLGWCLPLLNKRNEVNSGTLKQILEDILHWRGQSPQSVIQNRSQYGTLEKHHISDYKFLNINFIRFTSIPNIPSSSI